MKNIENEDYQNPIQNPNIAYPWVPWALDIISSLKIIFL